ncbi:DUF383-domain-containing protein [Meredithblackwellia eburnea MCA 4105]
MSHIPQLLELCAFLSDKSPQVRRIALAELLPYTAVDKTERNIFLREHYIEQVATLCADQELIAHDALSALINLTNSAIVVDRVSKVPGFLEGLVSMIISEKALLADLGSMLLSNMTKIESVSKRLLDMRLHFPSAAPASDADAGEAVSQQTPAPQEEIEALDLLLEVFLKGEGKKYNPNADYDFLASVFANISTIPAGRSYLLSTTSVDQEPPLVKLISFTEHPSTIRRGGVASSIKNSAFVKSGHSRLVAPTNDEPPAPGCIDLLPQMLLPLCGPEEFDLEDMEQLPETLQLLGSSKVREPDSAIRLILVETLLLLASTRACRESMRKRGVYFVIRAAHLAETVKKVTEPMVRLVDLLMREEGPDTAIEEIEEEDTRTLATVTESETETVSLDAAGKPATSSELTEEPSAYLPPVTASSVAPKTTQVDSEDEEEMLLEV